VWAAMAANAASMVDSDYARKTQDGMASLHSQLSATQIPHTHSLISMLCYLFSLFFIFFGSKYKSKKKYFQNCKTILFISIIKYYIHPPHTIPYHLVLLLTHKYIHKGLI